MMGLLQRSGEKQALTISRSAGFSGPVTTTCRRTGLPNYTGVTTIILNARATHPQIGATWKPAEALPKGLSCIGLSCLTKFLS